MAIYSYKAFNNIGTIKSGSLEAGSKDEALNLLSTKQLTPVSIQEKSATKNTNPIKKVKIKSDSVLVFTRQLQSLIHAGIPLTESINLMIEQSSDIRMQQILRTLYEHIREGKSFSNSLRQFPNVFTELYVNSIQIAESGGNFEEILKNLVSQLENEAKISKNLKKALSYPAFLIAAIIMAFVVFATYIIPKFLPIFEKTKTELPLPTHIVIVISNLFHSYGIALFLILVIIGLMCYRFSRGDKGKYKIHYFLLKVPFISSLVIKVSSQKFCQTISILIGQGIPLIQAMDTAIKTESNYVLKEKIENVRRKVENGHSIAAALKTTKIFPKIMIHMISVGEVTGTLEQMMTKVAEFYQLEISNTIESITSLIEPVVTIVLAVLVLFLALSIFLPMWNMMSIAN